MLWKVSCKLYHTFPSRIYFFKDNFLKLIFVGTNLFTEMYSILAAEVEDQTDPSTGMDWDLLAELKIADKILICGQALRYV